MNVLYVTDKSQINKVVSDVLKSDEVGIDVEATSLDVFSANWLLLQIEANSNIYVLDIRKLNYDDYHYLISLIKDSGKRVLFHNSKYDMKVIYNNTGELFTNVYDTMIAEVLINQGVGKQYYSYAELVEKYLGITIDKEVRSTFIDYDGPITNEQINYSAIDVRYLRDLKKLQVNILAQQRQSYTLDLESQLIPVVATMELNGVQIDEVNWRELSIKNKENLIIQKEQLLDTIVSRVDFKKFTDAYQLSGMFKIPVKTKKAVESTTQTTDNLDVWFRNNLNLNSPAQVLMALNICGIPVKKTGEKELNRYKGDAVVDGLLLYREYEKNFTTYGENFLQEKHLLTKRYHFEYNQVGTYTGRFSVSRMQQIPRDKNVRRCFIARDDFSICTADFSQQEYRLAGALTGDRRIIESYLMGKDMHTATGGVVYKVSIDAVTPDMRQNAKSVNFALLYDSTVGGLAYNLNINMNEAEELVKLLNASYPTFIEYREYAKKTIWEKKMATTPLGRKRYFEDIKYFNDINERDRYKRRVMREGWNHMIQGWGADITKISMNNIFYENPFGDSLRFYNQAHDEIDLEILTALSKDIAEFSKDCMLRAEQPQLGEIPAAIDYKILPYWSK
jgi:DNA polymerase I-like protein with 3'-5' exonuclease and polymerase domains